VTTALRRLTILSCSFILCGCVATQKDILDLSAQTDSLTVQIQGLKKSLSAMQANQADLAVKLDSVHEEISVLNESLKDAQQSNSQLSSKLDDIGSALGAKVTAVGETLTAQQKRLAEQEEKRAQQEQQKIEETKKQEAEDAAGPTPSQLYHSALVQLNQKKYDLAAQGFSVYLQKNPKGEVADLSTYYLGQALYAQKKYEDAARQYALLLDRYPKSDLTPSARLKYASCLMTMKTHLDEAQRYLQSIPEDFPKSPEAKLAAPMLKQLQKELSKPAGTAAPKTSAK
jgi:tol-pal system protein YbgF